ncbi:MAG: hypothetical protein M4579_005050 [Chaenotheca gracillima]|nr:MAG: hypothetical protein M4579_005050 [Chaenotheca gracillima]
MKFAKELEDDLVPEWRAKYFDYKIGKKKLKAVSRALRGINVTPGTLRSRPNDVPPPSSLNNLGFVPSQQDHVPPHSILINHNASRSSRNGASEPLLNPSDRAQTESEGVGGRRRDSTSAVQIPQRQRSRDHTTSGPTNYGSIVPSPPATLSPPRGPPSLELPDPALDPDEVSLPLDSPRASRNGPRSRLHPSAAETSDNAYQVGKTHAPPHFGTAKSPTARRFFAPRRTFSSPTLSGPRPLINRLLSHRAPKGGPASGSLHGDVRLDAYREFDLKQAQFFSWMDQELNKIETFYRSKEDEAGARLQVLRAQLHEMRDRRLEEVIASQRTKEKLKHQGEDRGLLDSDGAHGSNSGEDSSGERWPSQIKNALNMMNPSSQPRVGKNTKALENLGSPSHLGLSAGDAALQQPDSRRDFVRRHYQDDSVPYRQAKRKLKTALSEFYRGLELLKSYSLLNRTAFRKINKKYDKAVQARPTGRYMSEKVNKSWFVQSEVLDGHIQAVEDLYARYFERGNHKVAVGKLRSKHRKGGEYYATVCRNGALLGAGLVFGIQGIVYGAELLFDPDSVVRLQTSYLLQIPCFFVFLEGFFMWLNFQRLGSEKMFIYYPVILIGLTVLMLFFPAKVLYHRSRTWWLYSNWRLLLAGIYPVEFRDFFLGDQYCSQTYSMGNIELFFCLYAQHWSNPPLCNSTNSRLLGFFTTLPGIWRALQCLRRYYDTRNIFPHLVNGGKYTFTILYYMSLSLYRIDKDPQMKALFIFCATVNAVYCSVWDIAMDWSLGNPYAPHPFLRETLGYKRPSVYYIAMIIDPILRFNWIFYVIYTQDLQHSAVLSFFVAFSEVLRRGLWSLFRVENEHCTNVGRFRASRDVPLPYELPTPSTTSLDESPTTAKPSTPKQKPHPQPQPTSPLPHAATTDLDLERAPTHRTTASTRSQTYHASLPAPQSTSPTTLRLRRSRGASTTAGAGAAAPLTPNAPSPRGFARVGTMMAEAHAQDFERKRRPTVSGSAASARGAGGRRGSDEAAAEVVEEGSSDDDEEDNEDDEVEVLRGLREADRARSRHGHGHGNGEGASTAADGERDSAREVADAERLLERHRSRG